MTVIATTPKPASRSFGRRALLVVTEFNNPRQVGQPSPFVGDLPLGTFDRGLDLSQMHFRFETQQMDDQSPNTCTIRVYNLADQTVKRITNHFDGVVVQAGYESGAFGTIFAGAIKQFRIGRESNVSSYLDILATDGDIGYNFGIVASTLGAGMSLRDAINKAATAMGLTVKDLPPKLKAQLGPGQAYIRAKVAWGMGRNLLRDAARSLDASWSIVNGEIQFTPLDGYQPGEAVVLNSKTGLIGLPELTDDGVKVRVLMNPKIKVGGLIRINNDEVNRATINRTVQQNPADLRQFNAWADVTHLAKVSADGTYQVFVAEHHGDTRGAEWYTDLTCLSVAISASSTDQQVKPYG